MRKYKFYPFHGYILVCLFFLISAPAVAAELPEQVKDIYAGGYSSNPSMFTDVGGIAYFIANSGFAYGQGNALWRSDGTEAGTVFVKDLDIPDYPLTYGEFTSFKGQLFFRGLSGSGYELWKSNGTADGTTMVKDIHTGVDYFGGAMSGYPEELVAFDKDGDNTDDMLLFLAKTEAYGKELWRSDGTEAGTYMVKDINVGVRNIDSDGVSYRKISYAVSDNIFYFSAIISPYTDSSGNYIGGYELWRSDGTETGTYMVVDLTPTINVPYGPGSSNVSKLTDLNGLLIFTASAGLGTELYRSNGTAGSTAIIKDINPTGHSYPSHLVRVGNRIFFIADDGVHGRELWVTDGSTEGTHMVADLVPGAGGIVTEQLEQMTSFRGLLYFRFNDGEYNHGFELWVSDGTTLGTHLFKDIGTGLDQFGYAASSYPDELTVVGGKMFFSAWDPVYARELWETDGTVEGTRIVADMSTVNNSSVYQSSNPNQLANINGELYFSAKNYQYLNYPESGYEVWRLQQPVIKRIRLCPGIMGLLLD